MERMSLESAQEEAAKLQEKITNKEAKDYPEAEKLIENENSESGIEKEKESYPITMMYRNNDLFEETVPLIVKTLESLGHKVKSFSFPAGTEYEERMKKMKEENMITAEEILGNTKVITDCTASIDDDDIIGIDNWNKLSIESQRNINNNIAGGYLDGLVDKATASMLLGDDYVKSGESYRADQEQGEVDMELALESFKAVIKRILEDKNNIPNEIHVLPTQLNNHLPFTDKVEKNEAAKILQDKVKELLAELEIDIECLVDIDLDNMKHTNAFEQNKGLSNEEKTWIIADRHVASAFDLKKWSSEEGSLKGPDTKAKILQFPVPSMLKSAMDQELIFFTKEEKEKFDQILVDILKEDFGEEQKEQE